MHTQKGFSLLEILVSVVIISIGVSMSIPTFLRSIHQGEVDRYTQQLEGGFFNLKARLGVNKATCTINFKSKNTFKAPVDIVEARNDQNRLECCGRDVGACVSGEEFGKENPLNRLRLLNQEGTPESKQVKVASNMKTYELTPPGTSTGNALGTSTGNAPENSTEIDPNSHNLILRIRSSKTNIKGLRERCIEISGITNIKRGTWDDSKKICEDKFSNS